MSDSIIAEALAFLRGHTRGDLRFDEHLRPVKYVVMPDGRLAAPVMVAMLEAADTVLFVPECIEGAMEVQVTLEPFLERGADGASADRWRIYHGREEDVRWAYLIIDAARFKSMVIDGVALAQPNPLAGVESLLCREMNQEHADDLRALCARFANYQLEKPVMVGADAMGIDIRAMFDVVRVPFIRPVGNVDEARAVLAEMMHAARTATGD